MRLFRKTSPSFTRDDAASIEAARTRFFAAASLGEKQAVTPEGFLICYDVPAARTGIMWYAEGEVPIKAVEGRVQVMRDESEVFRPEFIASFAGKPVVNDHPPVEVRPENWKTYAVGTVFNPRRGAGMMSEMLLVDLVIYDPVAISDIRSGKREVSCGYDAEYEETQPGQGRQYNMVGNHIALVESGRCGSRCSIGDRKTEQGDEIMRTLDHRTVDDAGQGKRTAVRDWFKSFTDGLREAMKKGGDALDKYLSDATNSPEKLLTADEGGQGAQSGELHLHLPGDRRMSDEDINKKFEDLGLGMKSIGDMVAGIAEKVGYKPGEKKETGDQEAEEKAKAEAEKKAKDALKEEAPAGTTDAAIAAGTKDSALLEEAYRETVSLAEILVPGARPTKTFDRAAPAQTTLDALCGFRRTVLDLAYHQAEGRAMIDQLTGGKPFDSKAGDCTEVKRMFRSAATMRKTANDAMLRARQAEERGGSGGAKTAPRTAAELNALHAKHYGYSK